MLRCAVLILAAGVASAQLADTPLPQWGSPNMVEGVIHLPRSEAKESFQAWFDDKNSRSRIDYNGGTVKTYQLPKENAPDKHIFYKYYPTGSDNTTCMCNETDGKHQSGLPDTTGYTLAGSEAYNFGGKASKWQREVVSDNLRYVLTLWVKYDEQGATAYAVPIKYEALVVDTAMGTQIDHFHMDYTNYVVGDIDPDIFVPKGHCDITYDLNMNPMEEFVGPSKHAEKEFDRFKNKHERQYETEQEHDHRLSIFRHNLRYIESHNRAGHSYMLAVNHFADRTPEELAAMRGPNLQADLSDSKASPFPYSDAEVEELSKEMPEVVDLRLIGAVSPVRDYGSCNAVWAYTAVGTVEGALFRHNKRLVKLSEQALLDCAWKYCLAGLDKLPSNTNASVCSGATYGCTGGVPFYALNWIKKNSLPTDEEYGGYLEQYGVCHLKNMTKTYSVDAVVKVPYDQERKLKLAIFRHGPVTVGISVTTKNFFFYSHGIYNEVCDTNYINFWMLAVGFGVQDGQKYWLLKNAWGPHWGSEGYMLISAEGNVCNVESVPFYVEIARS